MPVYEYKCSQCGEVFERYAKPDDFELPVDCECGHKADRIISLPRTDLVDNPRWSSALAVDPSQVASGEAYVAHPGAKFDAQGRMLIRNRKEKLQRIKERNRATGSTLHELD